MASQLHYDRSIHIALLAVNWGEALIVPVCLSRLSRRRDTSRTNQDALQGMVRFFSFARTTQRKEMNIKKKIKTKIFALCSTHSLKQRTGGAQETFRPAVAFIQKVTQTCARQLGT